MSNRETTGISRAGTVAGVEDQKRLFRQNRPKIKKQQVACYEYLAEGRATTPTN